MPCRHLKSRGFTLIELSIVLVVIGLIVGGVLVGRDLIRAAAERAQIAQIETIQTAANNFKAKYEYLPGDLPNAPATRFGFSTGRSTTEGLGNGNGLLADSIGGGWGPATGELAMFWVDLTYANGLNLNMIEGSFRASTFTTLPDASGSALARYFPTARINSNSHVLMCYQEVYGMANEPPPINYVVVQNVSSMVGGYPVVTGDKPTAFTVRQAYNIDRKIDDGMPLTGTVLAMYHNDNDSGFSYVHSNALTTGAVAASATSCFHGSGSRTGYQYSLTQNNGAGGNCALAFMFKQ